MSGSVSVLKGVALRLNRAAGRAGLPPLILMTDPARTPDPLAAAARLPRGSAVIYRHFGAAGRHGVARDLARLCRRRGLVLLIAADPALALRVRADGVHLPERMAGGPRPGPIGWIVTAAAHGPAGLRRAAQAGADAALLSPIFPSRSAGRGATLGAARGGWMARRAGLPVYALGGVNAGNAAQLIGRGFAGIAAIDGLID